MKEEIKKILEQTFAYTVENDKVAQELLDLFSVNDCLLPTNNLLEQIIEDNYKQQYGTNYDEINLENAKNGGLIIANWILNNC